MVARLVHISRPVLWVNTIGTTVVAVWLTGDLWRWEALPLLLWATLPFNLLIYGVNDVFDQETDAQNARKGGVEGARIASSESRGILLAIALTNLPFLVYFAVTMRPDALAWVAAYILIFVFYSAPPLRFKARVALDSLSNAAYAFPLVFVPWLSASSRSGRRRSASWRGAWPSTPTTPSRTSRRITRRASARRRSPSACAARSSGARCGGRSRRSPSPSSAGRSPSRTRSSPDGSSCSSGARRRRRARGLYRYSIVFPYAAGSVAGSHLVAAILLGSFA